MFTLHQLFLVYLRARNATQGPHERLFFGTVELSSSVCK
jgi:hypothetical protein